MLNYNHLFYFYQVAKKGNLTLAAKDLRISQPSLTIQIKTLESQMGKKLFQKKGRNIELTSEGQKIYTYCSRIFQTAQELIEHIHDKSSKKENLLSLAVSYEVDSEFLIDHFQSIHKSLKNTFQYQILNISEEAIIDASTAASIDVFITNRVLKNVKEFNLYNFFEIPVNLFHSQIHKTKIKNLILPSSKFLLRSETNLFLKDSGQSDHSVVLESDFIPAIIRAVINGLGAAYLPVNYMLSPMEEGLVNRYGPQKGYWKHEFYVYWKQQDHLQHWMTEFVKSFINKGVG